MEDMEVGFDLLEQPKVVNHDIEVTFTPSSSVKNYQYRIINGEVAGNYIPVNHNKPIVITLDQSGTYEIEVVTNLRNGRTEKFESGIYRLDKDIPTIVLSDDLVELKIGKTFDPFLGVQAQDLQDGELTKQVTSNYQDLDLTKEGPLKLIYQVEDSAGNIATKSMVLNMTKPYESSLLYIQIGILGVLLAVLIFILRYQKSMRLERRLSKYSVEAINETHISLFDGLLAFYRHLLQAISQLLSHSVFLQKYSYRYEKYRLLYQRMRLTAMDMVATKFLMAFGFLLIAIVAKAVQFELLLVYEIVLPFIAGFFAPDLLLMVKYRLHRSKIENDLLQAIIIMNNAFKSGRSITQAIELVSIELEGPIAEEFKKMALELSFGLSIDVVFERFSGRINLDEVRYLTASLSILNKTGGNIIKVFSSIEKSLFNKKKLKLELASLTGSSRMIVYVLFAVPFLFAAFISIINPEYFVPLFTTQIGLIILAIIIIMYIIYVIFVSKIMKVRM